MLLSPIPPLVPRGPLVEVCAEAGAAPPPSLVPRGSLAGGGGEGPCSSPLVLKGLLVGGVDGWGPCVAALTTSCGKGQKITDKLVISLS